MSDRENRVDRYNVLSTEVTSIPTKLQALKSKFVSFNKTYRSQKVDKFASEKNILEKRFTEIAEEIEVLNADGIFNQRTYFQTNVKQQVLKLCDELEKLFDKSRVQSESEDEENQPKMSKPGQVQKICNAIIEKFDQKRIRQFIKSVEMAILEFDNPDDIVKVVTYAKLKVTGCTKIEVTDYKSFDELKKDLLLYFKPQKSLDEVHYQVTKMVQHANQTVEKYAKYASDLKTDYEDAKTARRGKPLDIETLSEMEEEVTQAFIRGLKGVVAMNLRRRDAASLHEAIQLARDAETAAKTRADNMKLDEFRKPKSNHQGHNAGNNFKRGTSRSYSKPADNKVSVTATACRYCKEEGHWVKDCPKVKEKNAKNGENSALAARSGVETRSHGNENAQKNSKGSGEQCCAPQNTIKAKWANCEK
jgi:hypothetical protein